MKKTFLLLLALMMLLSVMLVACGDEDQDTPPHTHDFSRKSTDTKYQKNSATCAEQAEYYYSCACGDTDTTRTFFAGSLAAHCYQGDYCTVCGIHTPSEDLVFSPNEDGTAYTVTGIGECTDLEIVIPENYNGDAQISFYLSTHIKTGL